MAKKRVYELAKDLGLSNKEMVDWLRAHEYDVKSHSSSLEDDQALAVVEKFKGEKGPKVEAPKPSGSGGCAGRGRDVASTRSSQQRAGRSRQSRGAPGAAASATPPRASPAAEGQRPHRPGTRRRPVGPGHRKSHVAADRNARGGALA